MIKYFLELDYCLALLLSRNHRETSLNGAVYLFLTKIGFLFQALIFLALPMLPIKFGIETVVIIVMVSMVILMYAPVKSIKKLIFKHGIVKNFKTKSKVIKKNKTFISLFYLCFSFLLMMFIGIYSFGGYALKP